MTPQELLGLRKKPPANRDESVKPAGVEPTPSTPAESEAQLFGMSMPSESGQPPVTVTAEFTQIEIERAGSADKIEVMLRDSGLAPESAQELLIRFKPLIVELGQLQKSMGTIEVTDVSQTGLMKIARETRKQFKDVRIRGDKLRKALKEDSLRRGRAIDGIYNLIDYHATQMEEKLLAAEQFAERKEAERKHALSQERGRALVAEGFNISGLGETLADIAEDQYMAMLEGAKATKRERDRAAKEEADRKAKEEQDRKEREDRDRANRDRIQAENERLRKENEEKDRVAKAERDRLEKIHKDESEKLERAARAKREKDRQEYEERDRAHCAQLKEAEDKRMKAENALAEKKKADARAALEKAARDRKAARAPDKQKLLEFAKAIRAIPGPKCATEAGLFAAEEAEVARGLIARQIEQTAEAL